MTRRALFAALAGIGAASAGSAQLTPAQASPRAPLAQYGDCRTMEFSDSRLINCDVGVNGFKVHRCVAFNQAEGWAEVYTGGKGYSKLGTHRISGEISLWLDGERVA